MNDLRQAAKMALEALEMNALGFNVIRKIELAIEALESALAKPERWTPVEIGVDVTPEGTHVVGMYVLMPEAVRHVFYSQFHTAPPSKPWVSLTDEEIDYIWGVTPPDYENFFEFPRAIEAKLKEKNNG